MHGFNHIAVKNRSLIERLIWACVTILAIYVVINISCDQWHRYNENPTVVTLEKDFRKWEFPLPAITECASNKTDPMKAVQMIKTLWSIEPDNEKFPYYMRFVETVANVDLDAFQEFAQDTTLNVDFYQLAVGVMPDQIVKPTWVENLNPKWIPVMTELGVCYSTNSVAISDIVVRKSDKNETVSLPVKCKYASFSCYVTLEVGKCVRFFYHSPYDVPDTYTAAPELCTLINRNIALSVMESVCGPGVRDLSVGRRRCLYTDEAMSSNTYVYSMNMCRRACRNKLALILCSCVPYYNNYEEGKTCDASGMACLSQYKEQLSVIACSCTPQCVDAVYQELSFEENKWDRGVFVSRGSVRFTLQAPRERYTREIVFHFQDLVVSFGGAAGFFLGASFLSFVEIFYFILERIFKCCIRPKVRKVEAAASDSVQSRSTQATFNYEQSRIRELSTFLEDEWRPRPGYTQTLY